MAQNPNQEAQSPLSPDLKVGAVVIFVTPAGYEEPAIVTRVWGSGDRPTVNLRVLPDSGDSFAASSVVHWARGGWPVRYAWREA